MRNVLTVIILLTTTLFMCTAEAAAQVAAEELVRPKGLLLVEDFWQAVTLGYEYTGRVAEETSSATHRFKEKYSLGTIAGVVDPHLLNLNLQFDLWYEQENYTGDNVSSRSGDRFRFRYDLAAAAFDREPYPVVLRTLHEQTQVSNSFSPSYSLTTDKNSIMAKYFNKFIPIRFYYAHQTSETSGKARDTDTVIDLLTFTAVNNYRDISHTQFDASWNTQEQEVERSETTDSSVYNLTLANSFYPDAKKKYSLGSVFQSQKSKVGEDPQKSYDLTETFRAYFGRALKWEAIYKYKFDETVGFDGRQQQLTENSFDTTLTHWLFRSLETRLEWHIRNTELNNGDELETRTGLWFDYRKELPRTSQLRVFLGGSHEVTDRDLSDSRIRFRNIFPGVQPGDRIDLGVNGILVQVVSVIGKTLGEPDQPFTEGIDYDVNFIDASIDIRIDGGNVPDAGIDMEVTYDVDIDPSVKYATDIRSITGTLSFREGRYRLLGSYYDEDNDIISGEVESGGLSGLTKTRARFDARYYLHRFGLEYGTYESGPSRYDYVEGEWQYDRNSPWGNLRLQARDRYTRYDASGDNSSGYSVNTLSLGASYSRRLTTWAHMVLTLSYANTQSDRVTREAYYFRGSFLGRINQLFFKLYGTSTLRLEENETTRDDSVNVEVTRYF